jgi:ribosomal RNA-processing protein 36
MRGRSSRGHAAASTSSRREAEDEDPATASDESGDDEEVSSSSGSESESDSDAERELERALADVPFGELQRARADGSLGGRGFSAAAAAQKKARRASKKRPMEISTKVRPPRFREIIQVPKKVVRDPRFEPVYGPVDKEGFRKRYNFLFDDELPAEKEKLQKSIKKSKDPNAIEEMKSRITWIDKQLRSHPKKNVESEILREHIKKEREATKTGKRPYYLKKSEIRERKLMNKYNELKVKYSGHMTVNFPLLWISPFGFDLSISFYRRQESLMPSWRSGGGRTPPKIIATCHIEGMEMVHNDVSQAAFSLILS